MRPSLISISSRTGRADCSTATLQSLNSLPNTHLIKSNKQINKPARQINHTDRINSELVMIKKKHPATNNNINNIWIQKQANKQTKLMLAENNEL